MFAACVVLAHTRLDVNKVVRKRLGVKKASFAPPEITADLTGSIPDDTFSANNEIVPVGAIDVTRAFRMPTSAQLR